MILFWLCFVIFGSKFASKFVARRAWRNNKLMRLPVHGLISEVGIDYAVENVSTNKFVWEHFGHYREAEKLLLVFSAPNQFLFFSPKFFADDRDWQRFRAVVAGKLPSK